MPSHKKPVSSTAKSHSSVQGRVHAATVATPPLAAGEDYFGGPQQVPEQAVPQPKLPPRDDQERRARIAKVAYFKAAARGFTPGHEDEDWLNAEREVDAAIAASETTRH